MQGAALYGVFIGVLFELFTQVVPQPAGSIVFWGALGLQLIWGATMCWRRTALGFVTAAMAVGGVTSTGLAVLASIGEVFPGLPGPLLALVASGLVVSVLMLFVESRVNRANWHRWREHMQGKGVWDILNGRHIPQLRNGGA